MSFGFLRWTKTAAAMVALTAILAVGCGGSGDSGKTASLVPEGSTLIADIDVAAVLTGLDLELLFDALPLDEDGPASFAGILERAKDETGVEFREVTNAVLFGEASDSSGYFGVVIYGQFDEATVVAQISARGDGPLLPDTYGGHDIYTPENDPGSFTLSVLDSETLAIGTDRALKDIIDVRNGDKRAVFGPLANSLDGLGERLFGLVVQVPADGASELLADPDFLLGGDSLLGDFPISLDILDSIETLTVAGTLKGENIGVTAVLEFEDEDAAALISQFVGVLIPLVSSLAADPQTKELLAGLELEQDGDRLTLGIELPKAVLFQLLGDLTAITGTTTVPGVPAIAN